MRHVGNRQKVRRKHVSGLSALQDAFRDSEHDFDGSHSLFFDIMKQGSAFSVTAALKVYRDRRRPAVPAAHAVPPAAAAQRAGSHNPLPQSRRKGSYADAAAAPPRSAHSQQPAKASQAAPPPPSAKLNMDLEQCFGLFKRFVLEQGLVAR
jgi:hypothetical protein